MLTIPWAFSADTVANPTFVNEDFNEIAAFINGKNLAVEHLKDDRVVESMPFYLGTIPITGTMETFIEFQLPSSEAALRVFTGMSLWSQLAAGDDLVVAVQRHAGGGWVDVVAAQPITVAMVATGPYLIEQRVAVGNAMMRIRIGSTDEGWKRTTVVLYFESILRPAGS